MKFKNILLSYLLQYPFYFVCVNGLAAILGINIWLCVPLSVLIAIMYDIGERID